MLTFLDEKECENYFLYIIGNHHLVPLLIPPDTTSALDILVEEATRGNSNISKDNQFIFANTRFSEDHTSGWHSLKRICDKLPWKHPEKIRSSTNRHRLSTILASMDLTQQEREKVYSHLGHSEKINQTIYQAPPAVMEITTVGKQLVEIDEGLHFFQHD